MSTITFTCPHCSFSIQLPASVESQQGNCPSCNAVVTITADAPANPAISPQQPLPQQPLPQQPLPQQPLPQQPLPQQQPVQPMSQQSSNPNLRSCPDCGNTISTRAKQCPSCGCPLEDIVPDNIEAYEDNGILITNLSPPLLLEKMKEALWNYGVSNVTVDPDNLAVCGETGMDWKSGGQSITGYSRPLENGYWAVEFAAKSRVQLDLWGRSKKERQKLTKLLIASLIGS